MGILRQLLPDLKPSVMILTFWLPGIAITALDEGSVVAIVAGAIAATLWCGYPYAVALSVPAEKIRAGLRRAAQLMGVGLLLAVSAIVVAAAVAAFINYDVFDAAVEQQPVLAVLSVIVSLGGNAVVLGSFFVGTMGLNDYRSSTGTAKALMSYPTFLAFFYGPLGGWVYTQRRLREASYAG